MSDDEKHRVLGPNTLVLYVDDTGDEKLGDPAHPVFAFGGVACVSDYMGDIINGWRAMKASVFPQVRTALHAKEHLKETRLKGIKREAVLSVMNHPGLARFGIVLTSRTVVPRHQIVASVTASLTMRFDAIVNGLAAKGYWKPGGKLWRVGYRFDGKQKTVALAGRSRRKFLLASLYWRKLDFRAAGFRLSA